MESTKFAVIPIRPVGQVTPVDEPAVVFLVVGDKTRRIELEKPGDRTGTGKEIRREKVSSPQAGTDNLQRPPDKGQEGSLVPDAGYQLLTQIRRVAELRKGFRPLPERPAGTQGHGTHRVPENDQSMIARIRGSGEAGSMKKPSSRTGLVLPSRSVARARINWYPRSLIVTGPV